MAQDWALIPLRLALYVSLSIVFGLSAFGLYSLKPHERRGAIAFRRWLLGSAVSSLLFSFLALVVLAAAMSGAPYWPVDIEAIDMLLLGSAIGTAWLMRVLALFVAALAVLVSPTSSAGLGVAVGAGGVALATLAWTGHGAMDEGILGWVHLTADILHLVAAGTWIGALLGLVLLVTRRDDRSDPQHLRLTFRALRGFATIGTLAVTSLAITGLINAWVLVGLDAWQSAGSTLYGRLLVMKLILFVAMVMLAALNRFSLTAKFEHSMTIGDHGAARSALRRSLILETACAVSILALVSWLGTLSPPVS